MKKAAMWGTITFAVIWGTIFDKILRAIGVV